MQPRIWFNLILKHKEQYLNDYT